MPIKKGQKLLRSNVIPYKIMVGLLYQEFNWATWEGEKVVYCRLAPMGISFRIPSTRLRDYLVWLNEVGYFEDLVLAHGWARITLRTPPARKVKGLEAGTTQPPSLLPWEVENGYAK